MGFFKKNKYTTIFFALVVIIGAFIGFFAKAFSPQNQADDQMGISLTILVVVLAVVFLFVRSIDKKD